METNYDEYMAKANSRVYKSRALHPGRDRLRQANRHQRAREAKTFYCEVSVDCGCCCYWRERGDGGNGSDGGSDSAVVTATVLATRKPPSPAQTYRHKS